MDHGLDRLPFFLLLLLLPFSFAHATSFGPMRIAYQVESAPIFVRGRVVGSSWVQEDRAVGRPFTYWKLEVSEPLKGSVGSAIEMRQPGGEIGNLGYRVAGSATFRPDEDVYVALRPTGEAAYEVMGLSSGKYTVERGPGGAPVVRSGLGFIVKDASGRPFSPEAFSDLTRRIGEGRATEEEKKLYLNKAMMHDHDPALEAREADARRLLAEASRAHAEPAPAEPAKNAEALQMGVQKTPTPADEPMGSSVIWWSLATALLLGAIYLLLRRR